MLMFGNASRTPGAESNRYKRSSKLTLSCRCLRPLRLRAKLQNCTSSSARSCSRSPGLGYASTRRLELSLWSQIKDFMQKPKQISHQDISIQSFLECTSHAVDNCQKHAGAKLVLRWQVRSCVCRFPCEPFQFDRLLRTRSWSESSYAYSEHPLSAFLFFSKMSNCSCNVTTYSHSDSKRATALFRSRLLL